MCGKPSLWINASQDFAEDLSLMLRTTADSLQVTDSACSATLVRAAATDGPYRRFVLPRIAPWEMRLLTIE